MSKLLTEQLQRSGLLELAFSPGNHDSPLPQPFRATGCRHETSDVFLVHFANTYGDDLVHCVIDCVSDDPILFMPRAGFGYFQKLWSIWMPGNNIH